jgi:hypothetical protein
LKLWAQSTQVSATNGTVEASLGIPDKRTSLGAGAPRKNDYRREVGLARRVKRDE